VVVETRDPRVPSRLRAFTGPVGEDPVENVERLPHLLRVRVRPEVDDPAAVPLAREHDSGIFVLHGHGDVRERLVVAEADVERWSMSLDEVLLEMEGLDLVLGDDHLHVLDPLRQLPDRRAAVEALLEVGAHAGPQRFRLPHVENLAALVTEEVDPRLRGQRFQLGLEPGRHGVQRSPALKRRAARLERPGRWGKSDRCVFWRASRPPAARAVATRS
jgi:hypothetical protein